MDLWSIEELAGPAFFQMDIEECEGVPLKRALSTFILNYEVEKREKEKRENLQSVLPFQEWIVDFVIRVQHMVFVAKRNSKDTTINPLDLLYGCLLIATKLYLDDLSYYTTLNQFHHMINYSKFTKIRIKNAECLAFGLLMKSSWNSPVFLGTRDDAFRSRLRLLSDSGTATRKTPVVPRSCLKPPPLPLKKKSKKTLFSYFDKKDRT